MGTVKLPLLALLIPVLAVPVTPLPAAAAPAAGAGTGRHAAARPAAPRPDLAARRVTATLDAGAVTASVTVRNHGRARASASGTTFRLSTDARVDAGDAVLGSVPLTGLRPRRARRVTGTFAVPRGVPDGTYRVIACADGDRVVRERRESDNCRASRRTVVVGGPTGPTATSVTVAAFAGVGGTVTAAAQVGGTCTGTSCTFPTGTGTVTFTPVPAAGHRFVGWSGATCSGWTAGTANAITFNRPTASAACTATFVQQVTVSWTVAPVQLLLIGSVAGVATDGTCATDPLTGAGSCLVDAGVGSVTLTATPFLLLPFKVWSGGCSGSANPLVLTAPTSDLACTATFGL